MSLFRKTLFLSLCMLLVSGLLSPSRAAAEKLYRIGISEYPGYAYRDTNGTITGIDVEYAYRIAQVAGLKIEIVIIRDAERYFDALDSGKVDMLFDAVKTPEREKKYLYAEHETGSAPLSVYTRKDDDRFDFGRVDQLHGLTFASEAGSEVGPIFVKWCQKHGFTPKINEYRDADAVDAAVRDRLADAGLFGVEAKSGFRTILLFAPTPYYIILKNSDTALKDRIDNAMNRILAHDPLYRDKLVRRYAGIEKIEIDTFTATEKKYIAEHPQTRVAVQENDEPYFSLRGGVPEGIVPDYYGRISALTGLKFVYQKYATNEEAVNAVKTGKADVVAIYSNGQITAYQQGLRITSNYATVDAMLVTRAGTARDNIHSVAVKDRSKSLFKQAALSQEVKIRTYDNARACFEALQSGLADAMICGVPSATWLINQSSSMAFNLASISSITFDLCGALVYNDETLCSLLDKAIRTLDYEFSGIVSNHTFPENNWRTLLARIPLLWLVVSIAVLTTLILALSAALVLLNRRGKEKAVILAAQAEAEKQRVRLEAIEKSALEKNKFFSNISHDMRTPLNAIIGFADLAQKDEQPQRIGDYLEKIKISGNLLLDLINDTLILSKMSSSRMSLHLRPVALKDICEAASVPISHAAMEKGITFRRDSSGIDGLTVLADRLNLQKIILNLLSNAVKFTPTGGTVTFSMTAERAENGQISCRIVVSDNGIGMSKDFIPHMFEPFVQEEHHGLSNAGTGLGLSIVKQLVKLMGGTIDVQSDREVGSTFTVQICFAEASPKVSPTDNTHPVTGALAGKKVLLCEDNEMNSEIAATLLSQEKMTVVCAGNGQTGVDLFRQSAPGEFAAILMDLRMPVMDGYKATLAIRALPRVDAETVPIIAMTADAFDEDIQRCLASGMNGHIAKPINPERLFAVLANLLQNAAGCS